MSTQDSIFNTSGKFPANATFWEQNISGFVAGDGITPLFSRVLGEQVYKPLQKPQMAFYNAFAGAPLMKGAGWTERAIDNKVVKQFKPKASASDDIGYYESSGIEKNYEIDYKGWIPTTLPSGLETVEQMLDVGGVGVLNGMLVDGSLIAYQKAMESAIQKKVISLTKNDTTVDVTNMTAVYNKIVELSANMQGNETQYNELTSAENGKIDTASDKVLCFMPIQMYNKLRGSRASLPSPGELVTNVEFIPTANSLATPITTAEYTAEALTLGWDGTPPVAVDEEKPAIYMCSADRCKVRPLTGSYRINLSKNGAGDFSNQHLIWKCGIAVIPWTNGIRVNAEPVVP